MTRGDPNRDPVGLPLRLEWVGRENVGSLNSFVSSFDDHSRRTTGSMIAQVTRVRERKVEGGGPGNSDSDLSLSVGPGGVT